MIASVATLSFVALPIVAIVVRFWILRGITTLCTELFREGDEK
jgi:hypothetical protein